MKTPHPYAAAADHRRWRTAVAEPQIVDPVVNWPFRITRQDKVVTAGSCFAQHLSRQLALHDYNFLVTETAHPILPKAVAERAQYRMFSARYGNIYTARQLLQLFLRAYGRFQPLDHAWVEEGRWYDPFRPQIQPGGFRSRLEYDLDRGQHLAAVRAAFETMDVFIFTLGLTEAWQDLRDGAVYPVCPGTAAGTFDPEVHGYRNFTVAEVADDLSSFIAELRKVNPKVRIIFTVSPVPLVATAEDKHVLAATTYSKSVLRVAAEMVCSRDGASYFPSYEIITGPQARGRYFAQDCRSVTDEGVARVMSLFFKHAADEASAPAPVSEEQRRYDMHLSRSEAAIAFLCDEERLDDLS